MESQVESKKCIPEEAQLKYLDKLEEIMGLELKTEYANTLDWTGRLTVELERSCYGQEAYRRISWLLYEVMEDTEHDPSDVFCWGKEKASITPEQRADILYSKLPQLRRELKELESQLTPLPGDVFRYLNAGNSALREENEYLVAENVYLKSTNEALRRTILAVCEYYGCHHRTTPRMARDVLFFFKQMNQICIPLVPDSRQ